MPAFAGMSGGEGPILVGSILIGADALVGEMVKSRIPHMRGQSFGEHTTLGVVRRGRLRGGVVYYGYRGFDIQIAIAFDGRGWALPGTLRALCAYPFHELGCERITAVTSKKNKTARAMLAKAGFRFEGVIRRGLDGVRDGFIYGLLKHECKWLAHVPEKACPGLDPGWTPVFREGHAPTLKG